MDEPKRGRGRPRIYPEGMLPTYEGAPKLNIRFDPDLYQLVLDRPEGARAYLEELVRRDLGIPKQKRARKRNSQAALERPNQQLLAPET